MQAEVPAARPPRQAQEGGVRYAERPPKTRTTQRAAVLILHRTHRRLLLAEACRPDTPLSRSELSPSSFAQFLVTETLTTGCCRGRSHKARGSPAPARPIGWVRCSQLRVSTAPGTSSAAGRAPRCSTRCSPGPAKAGAPSALRPPSAHSHS